MKVGYSKKIYETLLLGLLKPYLDTYLYRAAAFLMYSVVDLVLGTLHTNVVEVSTPSLLISSLKPDILKVLVLWMVC